MPAPKIVVAPHAGATPGNNAPELTVSELAQALKRTVEDRFGLVRVRGEISNYRGPHSSGHAYFCLKDAGARLDAVIWKTSLLRLKTRPEEGLEVIATGRITTFPGKSAYQIVIETIEPAGVGALMALLEERRKRLVAEGIFATERKQAIPFLPSVIGIVTSPTGAVIRDILHRLSDRFPRRVVLWPVRVQGETAAAEVSAAIAGFDALDGSSTIARPDVLVVARGGGSLEDLWCFNEESVVRAVAACRIPVISAVGHETDTTLIDFVADLRAPTPTAAAEKCVPVRADLLAQVADYDSRRRGAKRRFLERAGVDLRGLGRALPTRDRVLALPRQRTDRAGERIGHLVARALATQRTRLAALADRLSRHTPVAELRLARGRLDTASTGLGRNIRVAATLVGGSLETLKERHTRAGASQRARVVAHAEITSGAQARLHRALAGTVETRRGALDQRWKLVESLGYKNVLDRGFALVRAGHDGSPLKRAADITPGKAMTIQFADAAVDARADGPPRPFRRSKPAPPGQGSLF